MTDLASRLELSLLTALAQFTLVFRIEFASLLNGVYLGERVVVFKVNLHSAKEWRVNELLLGHYWLRLFLNLLGSLQSEDFFCGLELSNLGHLVLLNFSGRRILTKNL